MTGEAIPGPPRAFAAPARRLLEADRVERLEPCLPERVRERQLRRWPEPEPSEVSPWVDAQEPLLEPVVPAFEQQPFDEPDLEPLLEAEPVEQEPLEARWQDEHLEPSKEREELERPLLPLVD